MTSIVEKLIVIIWFHKIHLFLKVTRSSQWLKIFHQSSLDVLAFQMKAYIWVNICIALNYGNQLHLKWNVPNVCRMQLDHDRFSAQSLLLKEKPTTTNKRAPFHKGLQLIASFAIELQFISIVQLIVRQIFLCCYVALSRPTVKCEKTGSFFFFFFFYMSDLGEEFAKICIQWLKKALV